MKSYSVENVNENDKNLPLEFWLLIPEFHIRPFLKFWIIMSKFNVDFQNDRDLELVSKELNHLAAILHVYAGGLNFMK